MDKEYLEVLNKITEDDVFRAICGEDRLGNTKSMVSIKLSDFNMENQEEYEIDEIILDNPIVNIFKTPVLTMVDLTFLVPDDFEFKNSVLRLQNFVKMEQQNPIESIMRTIVLTIVPLEYEGDVYCSGIHGTFCIMPSKPDVQTDTIRFIFNNDCFFSFLNNIESEEEQSENLEETVGD